MDKDLFDIQTVAKLLGKDESQIFELTNKNSFDFLEIMDMAYYFEDAGSEAFLKWMSNRMTTYIKKGFVIEEKTYQILKDKEISDLGSILNLIEAGLASTNFDNKQKELFALIEDYASSWDIFHEFDEGGIRVNSSYENSNFILTYSQALNLVEEFRIAMMKKGIASDLFAREVDSRMEIIVESLNQTFDGTELYRGVEQKAANLLYLIIKDHPFVDGNKRVGSMLFLYYLEKNNYAWKVSRERKINDNALVALTLLIAESKSENKDTMINLIVRLLQNDKIVK